PHARRRPPPGLPPRPRPVRPPHHALPQRLLQRVRRAPRRQGHSREQPRCPRPCRLRRAHPHLVPRARRGPRRHDHHAGSLRRRRGRRDSRSRTRRLRRMPALIRENIEQCMADAVGPLGLSGGWNDLFWAVHPGGRAILDSVEAGLRLEPKKLTASRHVLSEYGNMSGPTVIFVLDEIRRRREHVVGRHGLGVLLGLGPGVSVETMVLRATW
uniref:Chalcone/stilbene synthase C-terminal domain-containing protein n=1 Tax=Aegilops tauschii subsp. strangulata TaxID=200361 RepID=A0A453P0Y1_AEGTS